MANTTRRVRAIIRGCRRDQFLAVVNNRVEAGVLTVMVPGGEIREGETPAQAVARAVRCEAGVTVPESEIRFAVSRSYEFDDGVVEIGFFTVDVGDSVPLNCCPDSVVSVGWMGLPEVKRRVTGGVSAESWKIQLGLLDALDYVFGDTKQVAANGGGREVARTDAPRDPRVKAIPFGGQQQSDGQS